MPCNFKYKDLEVERIAYESTFAEFSKDYPVMICPYIREYSGRISFWGNAIKLTYSVDDEVIEKVYENRKNKDVTKAQIKSAYEIFKTDFKDVVQKINQEKADKIKSKKL